MRGEPYQFFLNTPWGENLENQYAKNYTSFSSRFRFNGKEWDDETGNFYYGARYYDPKISVWLSVDPLAHKYPSLSPYVFVANNPVMLVDPDGRDIWRVKNGKIELHQKTRDNFSIFQNQDGREIFRTNAEVTWGNDGEYTVLDYQNDFKRLTRLISEDASIQKDMEKRAEKTGWDDALFSSVEDFKKSREELDKKQTISDVAVSTLKYLTNIAGPVTVIKEGVELINDREPIGETLLGAGNSAARAAKSSWNNFKTTIDKISNEIKTNYNAIQNAPGT
ncbi:MAG: RHS repeat-associated protein [Sediminicola sp.]|jgi:RHS repeat-associated protein